MNFLAGIAVIFAIGMAGAYFAGLHGPLPFVHDEAGYVLGRDFLNTWLAGKAAVLPDPGRFYDHDTYMRLVNEVVPQDIFNHLWSYPPTFLLLAAPLGPLSYPLALAAWTGAGLLALYLAVRGHWPRTLAILCAPAAIFCILNGQISFFIAAFAITALRLLDRRPLIAGLLIALCTIKPQVGFLFPVLLIASGRWRVFAAAAAGTVLLVVATCLVWGVAVWRDYVIAGLPGQLADMQDHALALTLAPWSPTLTAAMALVGLTGAVATVIQLAFTALAVFLVAVGCRGSMDERRMALFLACSVFATPYLLVHDLVAMSAAAVMLAGRERLDRAGSYAVKALFLLPLLQMAFGLAHIPGAALIPVGFALWAWRGKRIWPAGGGTAAEIESMGAAGDQPAATRQIA